VTSLEAGYNAALLPWGTVILPGDHQGEEWLDRMAWVAFFEFMPVLWAGGVLIFPHSGLTLRKKTLRIMFLVALGDSGGILRSRPYKTAAEKQIPS
jgi:hypothetical protein